MAQTVRFRRWQACTPHGRRACVLWSSWSSSALSQAAPDRRLLCHLGPSGTPTGGSSVTMDHFALVSFVSKTSRLKVQGFLLWTETNSFYVMSAAAIHLASAIRALTAQPHPYHPSASAPPRRHLLTQSRPHGTCLGSPVTATRTAAANASTAQAATYKCRVYHTKSVTN